MMSKREIADIFKSIRKSTGLTQAQLGSCIGKSQQVIGHWESGYSQPDLGTLFELCNITGISMDRTFLARKR